MQLHEKLRDLRKAQGLNLKELSKGSGISYFTLVSLERKDMNPNPKIKTLIALSTFYSLTIDELISGVDFK